MVVKMMRWPPWPSSSSKKLETVLWIRAIEGLRSRNASETERRGFFVEVQWKGQQKGMALGSLRRHTKRNRTKENFVGDNGVVGFGDDEEFRNVCGFGVHKEGLFYPWEIVFTVFNAVNRRLKNKASVFGTASLNLTEYASVADGKEICINIPLSVPDIAPESRPSLNLTISILEVGAAQELPGTTLESGTPSPLTTRSLGTPSPTKDEFSALKAGLRKVKTFADFMSSRKSKKTLSEEDGSDCRSSIRSEDAQSSYPCDTDSLDNEAVGTELVDSQEEFDITHPVSYESLALANCAQELFYLNMNGNGDDECLVYYSNRRRSDAGCSQMESSSLSVAEETLQRSSKRRLLPWKKRRLNYSKSLKAKGEPLLKKHYGEDGGDDIDYDRRQLSSSDESNFWWRDGSTPNRTSLSEFGDDRFAVGSWESKEITSRDGLLKLQTQVFYASIDQRSERAAGESACTALVAVIADWLQSNRPEMPVKSEFDGLIRDGSSEWRNLCENADYLERFPDKHFDLETVLQAKIRPLTVAAEKSFIGFFRPEGLQDGELDFLTGAMSFDGIWDEISRSAAELPCDGESSAIYIISWNDHFFVLKVERAAYYIIDTLGERLFEGCNQAYVLKFDNGTTIQRLPKDEPKKELTKKPAKSKGKTKGSKETKSKGNDPEDDPIKEGNSEKEVEVVCKGKESCKEYIKSFLAAIPLRELQFDLKKGLMASTPIHHRLQIEFHYTEPLQLTVEKPVIAVADVAPVSAPPLTVEPVLPLPVAVA